MALILPKTAKDPTKLSATHAPALQPGQEEALRRAKTGRTALFGDKPVMSHAAGHIRSQPVPAKGGKSYDQHRSDALAADRRAVEQLKVAKTEIARLSQQNAEQLTELTRLREESGTWNENQRDLEGAQAEVERLTGHVATLVEEVDAAVLAANTAKKALAAEMDKLAEPAAASAEVVALVEQIAAEIEPRKNIKTEIKDWVRELGRLVRAE